MRLIHRRRVPVDHYVLVAGPRDAPARLLHRAGRIAALLSGRSVGRTDGYTLIHNGAGVARRSTPQVHIVCSGTRMAKGLMYLLIGLRNLLH